MLNEEQPKRVVSNDKEVALYCILGIVAVVAASAAWVAMSMSGDGKNTAEIALQLLRELATNAIVAAGSLATGRVIAQGK